MGLGFIGPIYTWLNEQLGQGSTFERLDRFLGDAEWIDPQAQVTHVPYTTFDHELILLQLKGMPRQHSGNFRFLNFRTFYIFFYHAVKSSWPAWRATFPD